MSGDTTLLFVTQVAPYLDGPAGVHGVLDQAAVGVAQVAELHGLRARRVDDVRELDDRALAEARALALFTIGETPWSSRQRVTVLDRVRAGALAVVAIHSATDSCYAWEEYGSLVGARFDGHPWTQEVALDVLERAHPATRHLPPSWRWYDEVYQFRDLRPDAAVLLRVPDVAARPGRRGREAAPVRLPAVVVLRRRARGGRSPPASGTSRARGRRRRTCDTSPAASRGRWARVRSAGGRETVARTRNFSPWAYWMLQLEAMVTRDPCPVDDAGAIPAWRDRCRERLDASARRTAGAASRSTSRCARPSTAARTGANRSCSTPRPRCRCRRSCSSRTTAAAAGPAVLAQHGHGPGKSEVCGLDDDESRGAVAEHHGDYAHQLALRGYVVLAPDLRCFGERRRLEPARQVRVRRQPRARARRRRRTRSPRTSGTSPRARRCSRPTRWSIRSGSGWWVCPTAAPPRCSSPRGTSGCVPPSSAGTSTNGSACHRMPWNLCGSQVLAGMLGAIEHVDLGGADRAPAAADRDRHRGPDLSRSRPRGARSARLATVYDALGVARPARARRVRGRTPVERRPRVRVPGAVALAPCSERAPVYDGR